MATPKHIDLSPVDDEETAIDVLQTITIDKLSRDPTVDWRTFAIGKIKDRDNLHASKKEFQSHYQWMNESLSFMTPKERQASILFGDSDGLRNHSGECWEITSGGGFNEIAACVDVKTGTILIIWIIPEG